MTRLTRVANSVFLLAIVAAPIDHTHCTDYELCSCADAQAVIIYMATPTSIPIHAVGDAKRLSLWLSSASTPISKSKKLRQELPNFYMLMFEPEREAQAKAIKCHSEGERITGYGY